MKRLIYIPLLILAYNVSAQDIGGDYYVATDGSDSNPGTYAEPWLTWEKALDDGDQPGDTTYFRGGVYYINESVEPNSILTGTAANPICFFNYPGETPILDGINKVSPSPGLQFLWGSHIMLRGLTVRNHWQLGTSSTSVTGIYSYLVTHITIDRCVTHDIGYRGFSFYDCDSVYVYNSDSYNVVDSTSSSPGNAGDGFISTGGGDTTDYMLFRGCRAWHVSDDGWDVHTEGYVEIDSCWAFWCGGYEDYVWGNGIKLNLSRNNVRTRLTRKVTNSIMVYNRGSGLTTNDNDHFPLPMHIYNNVSAYNGTYGNIGYGFTIYNTDGTTAQEERRIFRNNVAYGNTTLDVIVYNGASYTHSNNTWDSEVTTTDADFLSVDSTTAVGELMAARGSDGSLPSTSYFKLAEGSDLIDAGVDVGISYIGNAPDINWHEYEDDLVLSTSVTITAAGSATTIETSSGTLQMTGTVAPGNASFPDVTWSVASGTGSANIDQNGLLQAVSDGTVTVTATTQDGEDNTDDYIITISNQSANTVPTVTTIVMSEIHSVQATTGGNVTATGGAAVTAKGVCWSLSPTPTISDNITVDGTGTGAYTSIMYGLANNTWYYVRAYATNSEGTAYGTQRTVQTTRYSVIRDNGTLRLNGVTVVN